VEGVKIKYFTFKLHGYTVRQMM